MVKWSVKMLHESVVIDVDSIEAYDCSPVKYGNQHKSVIIAWHLPWSSQLVELLLGLASRGWNEWEREKKVTLACLTWNFLWLKSRRAYDNTGQQSHQFNIVCCIDGIRRWCAHLTLMPLHPLKENYLKTNGFSFVFSLIQAHEGSPSFRPLSIFVSLKIAVTSPKSFTISGMSKYKIMGSGCGALNNFEMKKLC